MTLNFPNASRVYNPTKRWVSFWGHDASMEITFQVEEDALQRISPHTEQNEESFLRIFDLNRAKIERVANSAYSKRRKTYLRLSASDF